ncbi:MAG: NAD-dependent epimerase/dehydratase family protein [Candidatus Limnocylindria bacterium]
MTDERRAIVTGASGYLGSRVAAALERNGWRVERLVRSPAADRPTERLFRLGDPVDGDLAADLLVHAAYDFTVHRRADIWRVNVDGTSSLLEAARAAGVGRIVVLSTMSAYRGTGQLYGRAKLAIEEITAASGGVAVRPGLVYGPRAGGMLGALQRAMRLPVVPLVAPSARQFPVHEDDLVAAIVAIATAERLPPGPIGIAQPTPVTFREILATIASDQGLHPRYVRVPWQLVYLAMRSAETVGLRLQFRADSLLGLVRPAPSVPQPEALAALGVRLRDFGPGAMAG